MHTRLEAISIGSLIAQTLKEDHQHPIGTVTNTFPNSFYARRFNDELLFVTNRGLKSPVTINVDSTTNIQQLVKPHEEITVKDTEIMVGKDLSIAVGNAIEYAPQANVGSLGVASIRDSLRTIAVILRIIDTTSSVLDSEGMTNGAAVEFVQTGILPLRSSDVSQFRNASASLIGLGSGFTPSGDDVLGGFLAVYNSFAEKTGRQQVLLDFGLLKSKTNWVSAKLLDYMQRLILDQQMTCMIGAAADGNESDFVLALESLLPRGHTSGIDIAVGAVLGFSLAQDIAWNTRDTEILAAKLGLIR